MTYMILHAGPITGPATGPVTGPATFSCADVSEIPQSECTALVAFYQSTNGANWHDNTNWLQTTTPCDYDPNTNPAGWVGVSCLFGNITMLVLPTNRLNGPLPPQLAALTKLRMLLLTENQLSGPIPPELGTLSAMYAIFLDDNRLSGHIPSALGDLQELTSLSLASNYLSGPLPPELGKLSQLTYLFLGENRLQGPLPPELGKLSRLNTLALDHNELSGPLPVTLSQLAELGLFWAGANQLSGPLPAELGRLTNLTELDLSSNALSGPIPPGLQQLVHLQQLSLQNNRFSGTLPAALGTLTQLTELNLNNNQLTGPIPPALGNLTALASLNLAHNGFSGPIPSELSKLTNLVMLGLHNNQLTGPIPPALGNLPVLQRLWLDSNQLTGPIPTELTQLETLSQLYLGNNGLTGPLPPALGTLPYLTELMLQSNQLSGELPAMLGDLRGLLMLDLSNNRFAGTIPTAYGNFTQLMTLKLASNQLTGDLSVLTALTKLSTLQLDYNGFAGQTDAVRTYLDQVAPGWAATQTTPPTTLAAAEQSATSVVLHWTPVTYVEDGGFYEISYATQPAGPYTVAGHTPHKRSGGYTLDALTPVTTYQLRVRSYTPAHHQQQNALWSDYSTPATVITPAADDSSADAYEADGQCDQARALLADGRPLDRSFHLPGDIDWMRFDATTPGSYRIEVQIPADSPADVTLKLYPSCDGNVINEWQESFSPGARLDFQVQNAGAFYLQLSNADPTVGNPATTYRLSLRAFTPTAAGSGHALILVAGQQVNDPRQAHIHATANQIYAAFAEHNYAPTAITYLSTESGADGVDGQPSNAALHQALTDWAISQVGAGSALTLYLVAPIRANTLLLDEDAGEWVTAATLHTWLDQLTTIIPSLQINVILESSPAGAFITGTASLSQPGRVLIAATDGTLPALVSPRGFYFSDYFVTALRQGHDLLGSFWEARTALQSLPAGIDAPSGQTRYQEPLLEANGNGRPNELEDARAAALRDLDFGAARQWPPYIEGVTATVDAGSITVNATVRDDRAVGLVRATLYPHTDLAQAEPLAPTTRPTVILQAAGDGQYLGVHATALANGRYTIVIDAADSDNLLARPVHTVFDVGTEPATLEHHFFLPVVLQGH